VYGLADDQLLDAMPDGFAKKFLVGALKPRFNHIAPGLRIQSIEELLDQPYASSFEQGETEIPPLLILRGDGGMATPSVPLRPHPNRSVLARNDSLYSIG
jgi:hypothetical protein